MATKVTFKQGEDKPLTLNLLLGGSAWSIPSNTDFFLGVKKKKSDTEYTFSHDNADFTVTNQTGGIITVGITATDTDQNPGVYVGELKVETPDGTIDKSIDLEFVIQQAVIPAGEGS